jgi:hypothetical protein
MNLGWKLGAEVHGWAPPWLLDSYQSERHPVGRQALRVTDILQRVTLGPAAVRAVRPVLAGLLLGFKPTRRALRRRISGLSIAYPLRGKRMHPWVGQRVPDARLGETRLYELMRGGRFVLLDRTDDGEVARTAESFSDRVDVVRVPAAVPDWPAALLVRPDGYAAWAGDRLCAQRIALRWARRLAQLERLGERVCDSGTSLLGLRNAQPVTGR